MRTETKSAAKQRTEPVVEYLVEGARRISQLSDTSLQHLAKRLSALSTQAQAKRDHGNADLLRSIAEIIDGYRDACEWEEAERQPLTNQAPAPPPPARRVRWPEGGR